MPDKTVFTVVHTCGHNRNHDLSAKPPAERAGFARLLAWTPCDSCSRPDEDTEQGRRNTEVDGAADRPLATGR
jgi:hypothetical protein